MNPDKLEEYRMSEEGRFEDQSGGPYAYEILGRHKGTIEIRNVPELTEIYWTISMGTFQVADAERGYKQLDIAKRIASKIRARVAEVDYEMATKYYPDGA